MCHKKKKNNNTTTTTFKIVERDARIDSRMNYGSKTDFVKCNWTDIG